MHILCLVILVRHFDMFSFDLQLRKFAEVRDIATRRRAREKEMLDVAK